MATKKQAGAKALASANPHDDFDESLRGRARADLDDERRARELFATWTTDSYGGDVGGFLAKATELIEDAPVTPHFLFCLLLEARTLQYRQAMRAAMARDKKKEKARVVPTRTARVRTELERRIRAGESIQGPGITDAIATRFGCDKSLVTLVRRKLLNEPARNRER